MISKSPLSIFKLLVAIVVALTALGLLNLGLSLAQSPPPVDVALVLDTTGSMEFDTICYGCWARCGGGHNTENTALIGDAGGNCNSQDKYRRYPNNGWAFPYNYYSQTMQSLIFSNTALPQPNFEDSNPSNDNYIVIEAEFYSHNSSNWRPELRSPGQGYWAMQRTEDAEAYSIDGYGENYLGTSGHKLSGLVRHHPYYEFNEGNPFGRHYSLQDAQNNVSPRLEYDFVPDWSGSTYIHIRAQYMSAGRNTNPDDQFFWAVARSGSGYQTPIQEGRGGGRNPDRWSPTDDWSWIRLGPVDLSGYSSDLHTLKIWAGSAAYALDRIIITSRTDISSIDDQPATLGSASQRLAADPCNPIFGLSVLPGQCTYMNISEPTDNLNDPLFNAVDPSRGAMESIRGFVTRLDPKLDQAGFVDFSGDALSRAQLECSRASQARESEQSTQKDHYPLRHDIIRNGSPIYPEYDELNCGDPATAATGTTPISYTNVFMSIEDSYPPSGNTDIADGLRRGLHMLGINTDDDDGQNHDRSCNWRWNGSWWQIERRSGWLNQPKGSDSKSNPVISHCSRGQAAQPVIILLTDGAPTNGNPGDNDDCNVSADPLPYESFPNGDKKYRCIMYYAGIARDSGVVVYTIGLGVGADRDLLTAVAETANGQAYFVLSSSQLDIIFDQILANIYVRLIS